MPVADIEELRRAVARSVSIAGAVRALGLPYSGYVHARVKALIETHGISTAHFTGQGHHRGRPAVNRKTAEEILRRLPPDAPRAKRGQLHRALREKGVDYVCGACGTGALWRGKPLVLEIDHVNGDSRDNRLENLRYLCPSCHSQTSTHSRPVRRAPRRSDPSCVGK